jgi:hypothetical protein
MRLRSIASGLGWDRWIAQFTLAGPDSAPRWIPATNAAFPVRELRFWLFSSVGLGNRIAFGQSIVALNSSPINESLSPEKRSVTRTTVKATSVVLG